MTLIPQSHFDDYRIALEPWKAAQFAEVKKRLNPPSDFPCMFSQTAFRRGNILFSFVDDLSEDNVSRGASDLSDYVQRSRVWDGTLNTAQPLLVVFNPAAVSAADNDEYNNIGWWVLQRWHEIDAGCWPAEVASDPGSPFWTMCFDGMQLFVNMSNPAHAQRRSRNLGPALTLVINPRERFDIIAGDNPTGRRVRQRIRDRIESYDGQPHSPDLGSYQAGELEWPQYGLPETNDPRNDTCPFKMKAHLCTQCDKCGRSDKHASCL